MASSGGNRRRSSSLTLFNNKKKVKEHKIYIAAALIPTQAFAIAPNVRCKAVDQADLQEVQFSKLRDAALSNSLILRNQGKSRDEQDRQEQQQQQQQLAARPNVNDAASQRPSRVSRPSDVVRPGRDAREQPQTPGTSQSEAARASRDQAAATWPLPHQSDQSDQRPSGSQDGIVEDKVVKIPRRVALLTEPSSQSASAYRQERGRRRDEPTAAQSPAVQIQASLTDAHATASKRTGAQSELSFSGTWLTHPNTGTHASDGDSDGDRNLDTLISTASRRSSQLGVAGGVRKPRRVVQITEPEPEPEPESEAESGSISVEVSDDDVTDGEAGPPANSRDAAVRDSILTAPAKRVSLSAMRPHDLPPASSARDADGAPGDKTDLADSYRTRPKKDNAALREENKVLQDTIQRLSVELSRYQAAVAIQSGELERFLAANKVRPALGPDEPLPLWLVDQKYLSPLLASYDALVKEKDRLLKLSKQRLDEFESRLQSAVRNAPPAGAVFASQIVPAGSVPDGVPSNWPEIVGQCKLVLEDNAQLKETADRQKRELSAMEKYHVQEVSRLDEKIRLLKSKAAELNGNLRTMADRNRALEKAVQNSGRSADVESPREARTAATSTDREAARQELEMRARDAEAARDEATRLCAEVQERTKGFAASVVKLSSANKLLMQDRAKRDRKLAKLKQKVATMQGRLLQMQSTDGAKNSLLKDLMLITEDIARQRSELADRLEKASSAKSLALGKESLKLKWFDEMLRNSVDCTEMEHLQRRKLEDNLHFGWEAAVPRDQSHSRLSQSAAGSTLLHYGALRDQSPNRLNDPYMKRFDGASFNLADRTQFN